MRIKIVSLLHYQKTQMKLKFPAFSKPNTSTHKENIKRKKKVLTQKEKSLMQGTLSKLTQVKT